MKFKKYFVNVVDVGKEKIIEFFIRKEIQRL